MRRPPTRRPAQPPAKPKSYLPAEDAALVAASGQRQHHVISYRPNAHARVTLCGRVAYDLKPTEALTPQKETALCPNCLRLALKRGLLVEAALIKGPDEEFDPETSQALRERLAEIKTAVEALDEVPA